ncbi:hypothetical protein NDU88_001188 [Pleurodeles waltl]|uniref:Uncharacterized protein n=1 Tax=Pleurodeles waltl TaxID=8319 RepID=A0AAV7V758_PLEWA|nr:hypothetical protein NDU88_001188 [Pleurodeles waltl]
MTGLCRLCGLGPETHVHLICIFKGNMGERKRILIPSWTQKGLRRCKPEISACFNGTDMQLSCRLVTYLEKPGRNISSSPGPPGTPEEARAHCDLDVMSITGCKERKQGTVGGYYEKV